LGIDIQLGLLQSFQLQKALPLTPDQELCTWTPLGATPPDHGLPLCLGRNKILATALITHRTLMTVGLSMIVYVLYSHSLLYWVASVNLY